MKFSRSSRRKKEQGYILLYLTLLAAVLAISALGWIERVDFQIRRDREEELIHRGVQYSRAIRRYVKKFGRYPARIEDLQSTNNVRFLRKKYKDPITGKDFKLLHMNDIQISFSPGAASGMAPAPADASAANQAGASGPVNPGPGASNGPGAGSMAGNSGNPRAMPQAGSNGDASTGDDSSPDQPVAQDTSGGTQNRQENSGPGTPVSQLGSSPGMGNGPTFGGMPIVGVASASKEKSIREFNKKDHYNQWQFIYDPSTDRGGLLTTPNQPPLQNAVQFNPGQTPQQNGNNPNPSPSFGPGGMSGPGMNGNGMNPTPQPPSNTPQQQ